MAASDESVVKVYQYGKKYSEPLTLTVSMHIPLINGKDVIFSWRKDQQSLDQNILQNFLVEKSNVQLRTNQQADLELLTMEGEDG